MGLGIRERIQERQKARAEIEKDVKAFIDKNPNATKREVQAAMKKKWAAKYAGASPAWLEILMQLLPIILKLFGIG